MAFGPANIERMNIEFVSDPRRSDAVALSAARN